MAEWIDALDRQLAGDARAVVVTIARASGSIPREAGTTMLVGVNEVLGTIGGGHLEFEAIRIARDALSGSGSPPPWAVRFPLAARLGQCCGGVATLVFSLAGANARDWVEMAQACLRAQLPFARVELIGGAPDRRGSLLVTLDDATGSLGDPGLDSLAVTAARTRVQSRRGGAMLVDSTDGSARTLMIQVIVPAPFPVLVFGNGHVGRALIQILGVLPAQVRWIDSRDEDFPASVPPNVEIVVTDAPAEELAQAPRGACVVVMTHSHALDFDLVEAALARDDWRYLGLIGSQAKRNQFARRLSARGGLDEQMERVVCPIGVAGPAPLRGKEPGVIAIGVAAELFALRERAAGDNALAGRLSSRRNSGSGHPP